MRTKHGTAVFSKHKSVNDGLDSEDSLGQGLATQSSRGGTASPDPINNDFVMSPGLAFGMFSGAFNSSTIC